MPARRLGPRINWFAEVPFPHTSRPIDLHVYAIIANGLQVSQLEAMYVDSSRWHLPSPITTRKIINWSSVDQN